MRLLFLHNALAIFIRFLMKIFILDSGIGGISVLKGLKRKYPDCIFEYYADNANNPYGEKSPEEIKECVLSAIKCLDVKKSDLFVVACNTASLAAREEIKDALPCKAFFILPKVEYLNALKGNTLFLGTDVTVSFLEGKVTDSVKLVSPKGLPKLIENATTNAEIKNALAKLKESIDFPFDKVYLGCTHFSLKKELFAEVFVNVEIIDGAELFIDETDFKKLREYTVEDEPSVTFRTSLPSVEKLKAMGDLLSQK